MSPKGIEGQRIVLLELVEELGFERQAAGQASGEFAPGAEDREASAGSFSTGSSRAISVSDRALAMSSSSERDRFSRLRSRLSSLLIESRVFRY